MLSDNLNNLMNTLGISVSELASYAGFDRTNISHIKSGKRTPDPDGKSITMLIDGIYACSEDRDQISVLCDITGEDPESDPEKIKHGILNWLYDMTDSDPKVVPVQETGTFAYRFRTSMGLTGLSNIMLAHMVNVDASLISRYRTGKMVPRPDSELISLIGDALWRFICNSKNTDRLCILMGTDQQPLTKEAYLKWLFEYAYGSKNISVATDLLKILDSYEQVTVPEISPADIGINIDSVLADNNTVYFGENGLQSAVIRFLVSVLKASVPEIWLYSDQDMGWLTRDAAFKTKWAYLMMAVASNKTKIRIIHNIDRKMDEMNSAIASWLPLYMTGNIEPYYCKQQYDRRFSHTLFLAPDLCCVEATQTVGTEADGLYRYHTDPRELDFFRTSFQKLMEGTSPLIRFNVPIEDLISDGITSITAISGTLSLSTMPEEIAKSFGSEDLMKIWRRQRSYFDSIIKRGTIQECLYLPPENDAYVDFFPESGMYKYTPGAYRSHLDAIRKLCLKTPGYNVSVLNSPVFNSIKIVISNEFVNIIHEQNPNLSFSFMNPTMLRAFSSYADNLSRIGRDINST